MPIEMRLSRIIISEINEQQSDLPERSRRGSTVSHLDRHLRGDEHRSPSESDKPLRPLTHDLLVAIVDALGGELDSVVINDLREHTYYAKLRVRVDGELIEIDSRPSDAIAVAVTCEPHLPIYVSEDVLNEVLD